MNKNTNTQTDTETFQMSLQSAHFFPYFFKVGKYLLPLLAGLFILAACGGGGAAPTTVEQDTTEAICANNLFDTRCDAPDVEMKREAKIEECITGGAAGDATCKGAREADGYDCLLDPFAKDCTAETVDETFVEYLEPARMSRAEFCREGNNISEETELCGNAVTTLCTANPFDTVCFADATYQKMRIAACSGGTLPANPTRACTTAELMDVVCVATGANAAPFNTTICGADDGVMNAEARQTFCRANPSDTLCTNTISTFCAIIDADKFTDSLCGTPASAVVRGTYCVGSEGGSVSGACGNDTEENSLIRAYCTSGSAEALLDTTNCATSLANACLTAPFGHACTTDANIRARAVMCRNNQQGGNSCDATRTAICEGGGVAITANIFDDLCDVGYDNLRTTACANAPNAGALPSSKCGSETAGYLLAYCQTDDGAENEIHCPVRYEASGVRADRWQTDAVDADKKPLTPIPAGRVSKTDDPANFIVGGEDGLGFVVEPGGVIERVHSQAPVRLNILDDSDDDKSGFGYARVRLAGAGLNVERTKLYVGLLSGTNVGAPISDNSLTGVWRANLTYLEESRVFTSTFILDVNFGPNTLKTRANSRPSVISDGSRTLAIDGKFTETGVLYGTTNLYTGNIPIGLGTLSGVIGVDGAVGIFASDASSGSNVYVGGFVAALGCTDNPFNVGCTSDADFDARVLKCRGDIDANGAGGCDATARVICMDGRTGPNPITANLFDPLCSRIPEFVDNIITTCNNAPNNQGVFAVCPERIASLCPNSGARNPGCPPLAVTEGKVDFVRWARTATDATNTNKLTILPAITGRSDPDFSYVEGRRDGLELGDYFTEEETAAGDRIGTGIFNNHNQTLRLSDLAGGLDNTTSGATFRQFTIQNGNRNIDTQYYAGILSDTDLGAPISSTNPTVALWDARLEMVISAEPHADTFTMEVNFGPNTIKTRDTDDPVALPGGRVFSIDGKFTDAGLLYGTTNLTRAGGSSTGTLTGLIGELGAVGVFFSNTNQRTAGVYVGGFVAVPTLCESYPFAEQCTTDTDIRRKLAACNEDININGTGGCNAIFDIVCRDGNTGSGGTIVANPSDPLCVDNVRTGNADFILWKRDAVDTDGTTPLTILTELGADDAEENYVQAGADELNNDVLVNEDGSLKPGNSRISSGNLISLDLSDVGLLDDTASGMKAERYRYTGFTTGDIRKFYVGIFSGTDLGLPLTAGNTVQTIWNAKFVMVDERGFHYTTNNDFTLDVNFTDKTIKTRAADPIALNFGNVATGTIILTGTFTDAGVIYGTSRVELRDTRHTDPNEVLISDGSLTGLIGEKGAVGAFISDGNVDDAGRYAGGFVARNPNVCILDPFSPYCDDEDSITARADMCLDNMPRIVNTVDLCETVVAAICSDTDNSGSAINPFHAICGTDGTYAESRRLSCVNNRDGYSGSSCADLAMKICITDSDLFNDVCAGTYDRERQAECDGQNVDFAPKAECRPIIFALCNAEPFNDAAGVGDVKFDCAGANNYSFTRQARITLCSKEANNNNPLCMQSRVLAITVPCADDPFDAKCDDYATQYGDARVARLSTCRGSRTARAAVNCTGATLMICDAANDNNPLDTICADGIYDVQRQALCAGASIDESLMITGCEPVITDLCRNADAFSDSVGAGDVKFNCLGSDAYHVARQDACLYGSLQPDVCTATINKTCNVDKEYFSGLCKDTDDDKFDFYEQARLDTCAANADEIQSRGAIAEDGVIADCYDFLDVDCSQEPFEDKCYITNLYENKRLDKCSSDLATLDGAYATPADCNRPELAGAICGTVDTLGTDPFAPICAEPTAVAADFVLLDMQHAFCRDGANINGVDCADTITDFCDTASGADLFDDLCMTGNRAVNYADHRVAACNVVDANNAVNSECGNIIMDNCEGTPPFSPACAPAVGTLPTSVWVYNARNADDTARLKILEEVGLDDADTNYVQGNATGLNLGELLEAGGERKAGVNILESDLSITDLDNVNEGDITGGVAFVRIDFANFTSANKVKYYAGLLDNVDLGGPLPETTANAIWNASFSAIIKQKLQTDTDTSIVIDFDNKRLTTNDEDLVTLSGVDSGSITINARFNTAGVIYGTSSWTSTSGAESATGSVTGLIGAKGAIGAFVSSGENRDGEYAGGFVAAPVLECVGAAAFTNPLCTGPVGRAGRIAYAKYCRSNDCHQIVDSSSSSTSTVTFSICTNRTGGNPHQAGCESDGFDAERIARNEMCITDAATYDAMVCGDAVTSCFDSASANNCGQLVAVFCGAETDNRCTDDAPALAAVICRDLPFDTRCDTGYDEERQTACAGEDVTTPRTECMSVISTLCAADPLNNAAGAGETKFDCAGSATYTEQRQTACAGQNVTDPGDRRCLPVFDKFCSANPFNNVRSSGTVKFNCNASATYHAARQAVCDTDLVTNDCTVTIVQVCADDVFDNLCFDRADRNYGNYETARVSFCKARIFRTDSFTNDTINGKLCAEFVRECPTTPFDDKCKILDDDAYASQRLSLCEGAIDDLTAAYATPADCNTDDFSGAICGTVATPGPDPFAPICAEPTAVAVDFVLLDVQRAFCQDGANINEGNCPATVTNFCDAARGADLFDVLCTTGATADTYTDYRVAACHGASANTDVHSTCASVISTNCTGDAPFSPACVPAGTLPISAWLYGATNKDNTARLEILEEVGTDDAYTNYIQGDETGLNTDVLYDAGTFKAGAFIRSGILSIIDLDNVDDNATGGVATARISLPEFTDNPLGTKHRYYAGLLSNVDLGGPLIDNSADGIWNASFYVLYGTSSGRAQADIETSLIVNFDAKSIKTRELADIYGPADPVVLGAGAGRITINANFTTAGLIYGRSSWSDGRLDGNSSAGTVTGLIGKYGAIGAFVGSGKNISGNTQGEYAGGFVAAPVDCEVTGNPFYRLCDASTEPVMMAQDAVCDADTTRAFDPDCAPYTEPADKTAFAEICRLNADAKGCDRPINGISGLTVADCADNDTGNPYQTGCADDIFAAERQARTLSCGLANVYDAGQCGEALTACFGSATDTGCDVFVKAICDVSVGRDGRCDTQVPNICGAGGTDPLSVICETGYDSVRQELCDGQDIANPSDSRCLPVIATLCNDDPFATAAGAGTATFDCTEGDTYLPARVTACENDIDVNGGAGGCDATRTTACPTNPFSSFCDNTYQPARDTACRANPGAYGLQCDHLKAACTVTVNANVLVNFLNDICRDDPRYAVNRENNCLTDKRGDVVSRNNGNERYTICAGVQKSVIAYRCGLEPFNSKAGAGTRKFDCSTLNTFIVDRKTIDFSGFAQIRSDRVTLCKNPANRQDALCQVPSTLAFIERCDKDPSDETCDDFGTQYVAERAALFDVCRIDASLPQCDVDGVRAGLCTIDEKPFASFCNGNENIAAQVDFCNRIIDETRTPDPRCVSVTAEFCPTAIGAAAFNSVCDADYTQLQVAACTADAGADAGCTMLLETNCPAGNTKPECLIATTAVWENHAVNSDNTARLTVLDEVGRDDPHVNYVKAGADGLNLGFVLDENDNLKPTAIVDERVLKSYDGGTYEDTASGVAFAFINYGGFTDNGVNGGLRYYAGILSGTDLGGPVTNTTDTDVDWTGKYGIILSGRYYTKDFTLTINFAEKSISGTDTNGCTVGDNTCSVYDPESRKYVPNIIEKLTLTGNFNDAGVIYGTSRVEWTNPNLFVNANCRQNLVAPATDNNPAIYNLECTQFKRQGFPTDDSSGVPFSEGTLTGLIGERGAVGVFAGVGATVPIRNEDDDGNIYHGFSTGSAYVGGFVVDNPDVSPDCSANKPRNLFNLVLCPSHVESNVVSECRREAGNERPCPNLNLGEVRRDICIDRGLSGVNLPTGVTVGDCSTPELVTLICKATAAPLDPLCTDDFYDDTRQLVCGGQDVNNPEQPLCAPVIEKLCTAEPFNQNAGAGANKFDCASDNSVGVVQARNTRITLCLATPNDPLCKQGDVPAALESCADNPLDRICITDGIRAALTVCSDNPSDPICTQSDVRADLAACADDPRGVICTRGVTGILSACTTNPNTAICMSGGVIAALESCADNPADPICLADGVGAALTVCSDNPNDSLCTQSDVSATLASCADNPRGVICTQGVSGIVTACVINPRSALCLPRGVPSVLTTCAADPFDAVCTDIAEHYTQARETRLMVCRGGKNARGNTKCDNARPTLCAAGGTPFAQICEGYDTTEATSIARRCATDATPAHALCDTVVSTVVSGDDVLVKHCIENPYKARCSQPVFYPARAVICESEATSFTAGCLTDSNFASTRSFADDAREARMALITRCADTSMDRANCNTIIANSTTLLQCINNPFLADCSGNTIATALANSPDAVMRRDALVTRCADSGMDRTDCETPVGTLTLAGCAMDKANLACSGGVFDAYIVSDCTQAANVFAPRCQNGIDEAVITARAKLALGCAVADTGTGCDTIIVSGSLTVNDCNTNPFATGCEDAAFANIRRVECKKAEEAQAGSSNAACGVEDGQRITSYVQGGATGLELGNSIYKDADELATYMKDTPALDTDGNRIIDDSTTVLDESRIYTGTAFDANARVLREGIEQGGLTLNDLVDATGNETSGFAFAYIPGGRGADDINGWDRYYAGLLSGTDVVASLGGALTADATWNGKIAIVSGLNGSILTEQANFVLTIDFANKTLTSGEVALPKLDGFFAINGKFTDTTGVIYGATRLREVSDADRSSLRDVSGELSSIGSLTGLIGANGAVGAFISSGAGALVNTFGEYAGGFVAHKDAPDIRFDCTDSSNHLKADCITDDAQYYNICVTTAEINGPAAQDFCAPFVARYISRELACVGETDLNTLTNPLCAPVFAQLCEFNSGNIFNTAAGTGTTKFDCTSITEYTATRTRICRTPAYAEGGVLVERDGVEYKTEAITACVGEDGMSGMIASLCGADPFTQTVKTVLFPPTNLCDSSYNEARKTVCMGEVSRDSVAPQRCFDTIEEVCAVNPFDENFCFTSNLDYTATQLLLCYADMNANGECGNIIQANCQPTAGEPHAECRSARFTQWADDVNTDDSDAVVASIPAIETKKARILLGRANGLDTTTNVASILAPEFAVRFSLNKYNRVSRTETVMEMGDNGMVEKEVTIYENVLNEDYNNGIAVFSATTTNGTIGHYAGILSGTNVGLPITYAGVGQVDVQPDATWLADIAWVSDDGRFVKRAYDFRLNVDFAKGTISTPTDSGITDSLGHLPNYANTDSLSFSAFWTASGILIGTTTLRIPNPVTQSQRTSYGILTGMIGNDGAVGVFASEPRIGNDGQPVANPFAYAGGFIAKPKTNRPPVVEIPTTPMLPSATAWVNATSPRAAGAFTNTGTARYASYFILGLEDGLGLNKGGRYEALNHSLSDSDPKNDISERVLRLDDTIGSTGYTSGAAFFFGSIASGSSERYFTGLLSGATAGDNLPYRARYLGQASAIWGGVISARFGSHSSNEVGRAQVGITIDGNFYVTDRNFQIEVNFQASTVKTPAGVLTGAFYAVDLRLDGQFDRNGIMSGTVTTTEKTDLSVVKDVSSRRTHGPGKFNGIIGQDAAIGVFKADRGQTKTDFFGYVGGFYATPCTLDVSNPTCKNSPTALTAFCANRSANAGKNSFHSECDGLASIDDYRTLACLAGVTDTQSESRCPGLLATACLDTTNDGGKKPFQPGCSLAPDQPAVATAQRDACLAYDTFPDTSCQTLESVRMACEADPFTNTVCATRNDYAAIEGVFCATNTGIANPLCPNATSGDWVASITDLNTDPATATATNEFLQIAEQTISTAGTTKADDSSGEAPDVTMLNFSDISYPDVPFSADDGLAYFSGYQGNTLYHYAGVFGSTDLGAPITESGFSATWIGRVSINAIATPMYFTLAVTFDGTEGTVDGFIANITDPSDLLIAGTFAANGVLTGDVHYAEFANDMKTTIATDVANGSLSGLIGTDGVVAAFISTATGADGYAGGFVATPPVGICKTDVFDEACPVRDIITATTAFCTNITDNLGANPFNTGCVETTHGAVNVAQRDSCLSHITFPDVACQTLGPVKTACEVDFFTNVGCADHNDSAAIKATFCGTSAGIKTAACPNATSGDWLASLTDLNTDPATTTDITDTTPAKNEFLEIEGKIISTMGTTTEANGAGEAPTPTTLDFSAISYDGASLSADDGLAYFSGYQGGTLYRYAGIFGTTDLGAPITGYDDLEVTWPGMLRVNGLEMAFNFELTFDGTNTGTFDGTNGAEGSRDFIFDSNTAHWMALEGTFDKNGVITGVAHRGPRAQVVSVAVGDFNGTLSGLISAEGAVAVFFGAGYSGGFVAAPADTVNFGDWTRSFDGGFNAAEALLDADAIQFVANTANFTKLNDALPSVLNGQTFVRSKVLRLNSIVGEMGHESGFGFWHGTAGGAGSETLQYYAGLLPTTDLGAPLTDVSKNGTWTGKIDGVTNGDILDETEVKFEVIFNVGNLGTIKSIANETDYTYISDTVGAVNVNAPNTGGDAFNNTFNFDGQFNAQGVIKGTVAHTNGKPTVGGTVNGVFNGLIGINGAVGVFKSNDSQDFGFIGGFVANPPAE